MPLLLAASRAFNRVLPQPGMSAHAGRTAARYAIWGSELSPFALKLRALFEWAELPYAWLPAEGGRARNLRTIALIARAKRRRSVLRHSEPSALDEYPLVPFLIEEGPAGRRVHYDTSALARWLDEVRPGASGPLFPEDPALGFVAQLIDEAFDEFGLYLVHHKRWVTSAASNDAGARLASELTRLLPPGAGGAYGRAFARRQVRRLPYLFSVAPPGLSLSGLPPSLTPPSRPGFPATHELLDTAWAHYVDAVEGVLRSQPYLLGERFSVADASVYGQLGMNLKDPTAADELRERAPASHAWLCRIRDAGHVGRPGKLELTSALRPLLEAIGQTFVPLMQQNARAHADFHARGERLFNEAAFDRGRACYDGVLQGRPFRAVAKSFQVRVWRDLLDAWRALPSESRSRIEPLVPGFPISES